MPVPISGLATDIDVEGVIHKLVEVERIPIKRLEEEKNIKENEIKGWEFLKNEVNKLNEISKNLYGYKSVFKEKSIIDNQYFVLNPTRGAERSKHKIEILSLAQNHKILTEPLNSNNKLSSANFEIQVGSEKRNIQFKNQTTPKDLVDAINNNSGDIVNAQIIKTENNKIRILIESKKTGKENRISFNALDSDSEKLFNDIGLYSEIEKKSITLDFNDKKPEVFYFYENGYDNTVSAIFQIKKEYQFVLPQKEELKNGKIKFLYKSFSIPQEITQASNLIQNLTTKNIGNVTIKDVTVNSADIILNEISEELKEEAKQLKSIFEVELFDDKGVSQKFEINYSQDWQSYETDIKLENIAKIVFRNSSEQNFLIDNFEIFFKSGEKEFKNIVQEPQNAKIKVDGVLFERDKNEDLNDIIPDSILTLKEKTDKPVEVEIKEDTEKIKEEVKKFIEQYNNLLETLSELSKTSTGAKPGDYKKEERGLLSNDIALVNLQSKLRATVVDSYQTSLGRNLTTLAQIGISTGKWGSDWNSIKKGLLQMDDEIFASMLNNYGDKIGEIFGFDSNNDKIIDTGVAFKLNEVLKPYNAPKGLIDGRIKLAKKMIENTKKEIDKKEEYLKKYEQQLRDKFGKMESSIQQYKGMSEALDNALGNINTGSEGKKKNKNEE